MTSKRPAHEDSLTGDSTEKSDIAAVNRRVAGYFTGPLRKAAARALGAPTA